MTEEGKVTKSKGKQKKDKGKSKDSSSESVGLKDVNEIAMEEKQKISRDEEDVKFIDSSNTAQEEKVNASNDSSSATQSVLSTSVTLDKSTDEFRTTLVEVKSEPGEVLIGPKRITRFERARIVGARALQLSLGASPLITVPKDSTDPISIAEYELKQKALPISIRRILPDGHYQDIPIIWLLVN